MEEVVSREEIIKLQMIIQAAYPGYNPPDKTITVDLWDKMLKDWTYPQAEAAVVAFIRTDKKGFAPGVGAVIEKLHLLFGEGDLNEEEAWGIVQRAMRNSTYHADEEFQKLPKSIQKTVVSPGRLKELATMENMNITVESSNFKRTYRSVLEQENEIRKLPPGLMEMVTKKLSLSNHEEAKPIGTYEESEEYKGEPVMMPERAKRKIKEIFEEYRIE